MGVLDPSFRVRVAKETAYRLHSLRRQYPDFIPQETVRTPTLVRPSENPTSE